MAYRTQDKAGTAEITPDLVEAGVRLVMAWEGKYGGEIQSETASEELVRAILSLLGTRAGLTLHQEPGRWQELLERTRAHR